MHHIIWTIWIKNKNGIIFLATLFFFFIAIGLAALSFETDKTPQRLLLPHKDFAANSTHGRMLIVLLDSLQKKYMFSKYMPFLSEQRKRGAWGTSVVVSVPLSIAGTNAIFSGMVSNPLAIIEDFQSSTSAYDNLVQRVAQTNRRVVIIQGLSSGLYGHYPRVKTIKAGQFLFGEYRERSDRTFAEAAKSLKSEKWDLAVITCYSLDHVGHLETPQSAEYRAMLSNIDDHIREIVRLTNDKDTVLITSEHGMDDRGFHMDQNTDVMETGFIIWGPGIRKGGEKCILQIDWAPTLSILAGVSPYYNSPALPDLDLLNLSSNDQSRLLKEFSQRITQSSAKLSFRDLRKKRMALMQTTSSPVVAVIVVLMTVISAALLACVAVGGTQCGLYLRKACLLILGSVLCVFSAISASSHFNLFSKFPANIPFTANFVLRHPTEVIVFFVVITVLSMWFTRKSQLNTTGSWQWFMLLMSSFVLASVFLSKTPYYPLSWVVWCFPLIAFGITQRKSWIVVFSALWVGLAIRRLTFLSAYHQIDLPDRWVLAFAVMVVSLIYLWWKLKSDKEAWQLLGITILVFSLATFIVGLTSTAGVCGFLLVLLLIPVTLLSRKKPKAENLWLALWVVYFCLGTSSRLDHLTHMVLLPLLMATWVAVDRSSVVVRGIAFSLLIWGLYLLPGNGFDLNLRELHDRYIMSSVTVEHIEYAVMLIVSRFLLPVSVLLAGMNWNEPHVSFCSIASTALLPAICAIGTILTTMILKPSASYPWAELVKITVTLGYSVIIVLSLFCATVIQRIAKLRI